MQRAHKRGYHPDIDERSYSPHPIIYFKHYFIGLAMAACLIFFQRLSWVIFVGAAGLVYLLFTDLLRRAHKYLITNKGVIYEFSFISKNRSSALYDRIQYMYFKQGIIERIFGVGELHISTSGTKSIEIVFSGIKNPGKVKKMIEHNMSNIHYSHHRKHHHHKARHHH